MPLQAIGQLPRTEGVLQCSTGLMIHNHLDPCSGTRRCYAFAFVRARQVSIDGEARLRRLFERTLIPSGRGTAVARDQNDGPAVQAAVRGGIDAPPHPAGSAEVRDCCGRPHTTRCSDRFRYWPPAAILARAKPLAELARVEGAAAPGVTTVVIGAFNNTGLSVSPGSNPGSPASLTS